jgi:hypothetical protein
METINQPRIQYITFGVIGALVFLLALTAYLGEGPFFQRFLGKIHPLLAFALVIAGGLGLMAFLLSRGWLVIRPEIQLRGVLSAAILAALFGAVMILADTRIVFAEDTNLGLPFSLAFYPAIGFLVEVLFHLLPLALIILLAGISGGDSSPAGLSWWALVPVALLEPVYQSFFMARGGAYPIRQIIFVGVHNFLLNYTQLSLFKKFDFLSMYSFRLTYYLIWHILWGTLRLGILF